MWMIRSIWAMTPMMMKNKEKGVTICLRQMKLISR